MGTMLGLVAAKVPISSLKAAVLRAWPELKVASEASFQSEEDMWNWKDAHEQFVSSEDWSPTNRGSSVLPLWQDGRWAVLSDSQMVMPVEEENLATLSAEVGEVLALVVVSASGCAQFLYFKDGKLLRKLGDFDGARVEDGTPLAQEASFGSDPFYGHEEELWTSFGLASFDQTPRTKGLCAICVVDQTDYGQVTD